MQLMGAPLFSAVASLALCTNALADEPNHTRSVESGKHFAVYEGVDERGRIVRLTVPDVTVETFDRVSQPKAASYPKLHWTALIGTGTAAEHEK